MIRPHTAKEIVYSVLDFQKGFLKGYDFFS